MTTTALPGQAHTRHEQAGPLTGTGLAWRRAVRSDRWFWLVWVLVLWSFVPATTAAYRETISDDAAGREVAAGLAANPTMRAMLGPPFDLLNAGGFAMWRVGGFTAVMSGVMAALGVIRATRAEEEAGRTELLRAGAIGRHSLLWGAILLGLTGSGLLGLLISVSMIGLNTPAAGALCMGLGIALTAAVFVGVGACAAQLSASTRACRFVAMGALGAAYLLRALADGSASDSALRPLAWLSPVEWAPLARPYAAERWWVLALPAALAASLIGLAFAVEARRDHGAGLRPARPGPASAPARLSSAAGLAWRLTRGSSLGWGIGLVIFALVMGSLADVFETVADDPELAERFRRMGAGAQDLQAAFFVAMLGILVVLLAVFALQLFERLRKEEEAGHAEVILATDTARTRQLLAFVVPALVVPTGLLAAIGVLLPLQSGLAGDRGLIPRILGAAMALAPGVWLCLGLGVAVHGLAPRLRLLPWAVVGWSLVVNWIGGVLGFPQGVLDATPFGQLPQLPAQPMAWGPVIVETLLAAALLVAGFWGYRRRDIT
ncbi:MAG: hypothetical protein V9G19_19150 [Tetrasphaera sp.]